MKYLPGVKLPANVKAVPDLKQAVEGAHVLVWVLPHQFIPRTASSVKDVIHPKAISVSMVKGGVDIAKDGLKLCSETIAEIVGHSVSVIMGANVANEVARGDFCEATVGATDAMTGAVHQMAFNTKSFSVNVVDEVASVELCGAIKNVVALAAGFTDGLGMGSNTKAAIVRLGLKEMEAFIRHFYPATSSHVFSESCGVADLITTCFAGRNRKCAEAFAASRVEGKSREWKDIESELLNGQKLQGVLTAQEIFPLIELHLLQPQLPLICATYQIACKGAHPKILFETLNITIESMKVNPAKGTPRSSKSTAPPSDSSSEELVQAHLEKLKETHQIEKMQVCVIGSGNWGSTTAKIIGENILTGEASRYFSNEVRMWVFEEDVKQADGSVRKLSEIINVDHTNVNMAV